MILSASVLINFHTFAPMKKRLLQFGSFLMALVVLFVSVGWEVKFHYCTEDNHLSGSFGEAAESCLHCCDHEHEGLYATQADVLHFESKCCCDDFDSKIQFTDNFVFSSERHLGVHFQPIDLFRFAVLDLSPVVQQVFSRYSALKIPNLHIGKIGLIFFSQLKLNPLVF